MTSVASLPHDHHSIVRPRVSISITFLPSPSLPPWPAGVGRGGCGGGGSSGASETGSRSFHPHPSAANRPAGRAACGGGGAGQLRSRRVPGHGVSTCPPSWRSGYLSSRTDLGRVEPCRAESSRTEPSRVEPSRAEPSRAKPSRAKPNRVESSRAESSRVEPSRAAPSRAELSRAERSRVEPRQTTCSPGDTSPGYHVTGFWPGLSYPAAVEVIGCFEVWRALARFGRLAYPANNVVWQTRLRRSSVNSSLVS